MNSANTLTGSGWSSGDRSGCKIDTEMAFLNNLWGARNRIGIGLWYRPARLQRLAEFIPFESIPGLHRRLKIRAQMYCECLGATTTEVECHRGLCLIGVLLS